MTRNRLQGPPPPPQQSAPPAARGRHRRGGFTLAELLVVVGLIAMLMSLLLPVLGKARAAAHATQCLSNLRQMNTAWTVYAITSRGELPAYVWRSPPRSPELAWTGYWPGLLDAQAVRGESLLCPEAAEPVATGETRGVGKVDYAWSGKFVSNGTAIRLNAANVRMGSYGFNRYLTAGLPQNNKANKITAFGDLTDVPLFFDCAFVDALPRNEPEQAPPPPNLKGDQLTEGSPSHWHFLLARHGRAINMGFADGSARRVVLDDTYLLRWNLNWSPYRIPLPSN